MARLFGCLCNQPERLHLALGALANDLSEVGPSARWGVGYVHGGDVLLSRHPRSSEEIDFYSLTQKIKAAYFIGSAEDEDSQRGNANTQPFRFRKWLFAQQPAFKANADVLGALREQLPEFLKRNIKGRHSAEVLFHAILAHFHHESVIDNPYATRIQIVQSLNLALKEILSSPTISVAIPDDIGNMVFTNSRSFCAARLSDEPIYYQSIRSIEDPKRPETEFKAVVAWNAPILNSADVHEIPKNHVLVVERDFNLKVCPLELN